MKLSYYQRHKHDPAYKARKAAATRAWRRRQREKGIIYWSNQKRSMKRELARGGKDIERL